LAKGSCNARAEVLSDNYLKANIHSPTIWRISLSKKLYVGNLDGNVTKADLAQMFVKHGIVISALVCADKDSGQSKGFGFVEMGSDQEAKTAIAELNGKSLGGHNLIVNEANPPKIRGISGGAKDRNRGPIPKGQRF
jgi:RNA recognition motif-containing protein